MTNKSFISRLFNFGAPQSVSNTGVFLAANHAWVFRPENDDQRALCHCYPLHKDDWNSLFSSVYADFGPSKLQLALGFGRYQLLSADRPKVEADEMAQALVWAVKDMVSTPPTDIHLDYFESPIKSSDKLNVVVCSHSRLSALAQEIDKAGMQLVGISIEELLPTNLFNQDPLARLVISQVPGQELLLTVVREGELYMQRRIRGFAELHQTDAESLGFGVADTLSLEIQRSMDFFESQLRQAPVASIDIMVQGQTYALAQLVSRNFNQQVRPVDGMDVGMKMAELSYQELERGVNEQDPGQSLFAFSLAPRLRLSFARLLAIAGVLLFLGLSLIGLGWWQQTQVSGQLLEVESQRQALESEKQQLEAELAKRRPSAELVVELERRTQERELKGLLLTELGQRERMTSKGFAPVLQELAQVSDGSVWLSRIKLEEGKLAFEGFGQYPQSLPRWIDKLKQTESLRGRSFASMTMAREPGQPLAFVLTSEALEVKK